MDETIIDPSVFEVLAELREHLKEMLFFVLKECVEYIKWKTSKPDYKLVILRP